MVTSAPESSTSQSIYESIKEYSRLYEHVLCTKVQKSVGNTLLSVLFCVGWTLLLLLQLIVLQIVCSEKLDTGNQFHAHMLVNKHTGNINDLA